jgi:hypothetical protein
MFERSNEYQMGYHTVWQSFQGFVEQILENVLAELGGNMQALETALEQKAFAPDVGPADASFKRLLRELLTAHEFEQFAEMMIKRNEELKGVSDSGTPNRGFEEQPFLSTSTSVPSYMPQSPTSAQRAAENDAMIAQLSIGIPQGGGGESNRFSGEEMEFVAGLRAMVDNGEWQVEQAVASSLLDAHNLGQLPLREQAMLQWAQTVKEIDTMLPRANVTSWSSSLPAPVLQRLGELYGIMRDEKLRVDMVVAQEMAAENEQLRHQAQNLAAENEQLGGTQWMDDCVDMGDATEEEHELHGLLQQCDRAQGGMEQQRGRIKVSPIVLPNSMVQRNHTQHTCQ